MADVLLWILVGAIVAPAALVLGILCVDAWNRWVKGN